jgi:GTP diphosphokinase / guanosine-3',5'-bis(diphosphate) 3'-diphosphatase
VEKDGQSLVEAIRDLATQAHAKQTDRAGKPYMEHVLRVHGNLPDGADWELECIALGHDLVEDTKVTFHDLRAIGMTERVLAGIDRVTKKQGQSYEEYQAVVLGSVDSMIVKKADLTDNSDLTRLKKVTEKDQARNDKYLAFIDLIDAELAQRNANTPS